MVNKRLFEQAKQQTIQAAEEKAQRASEREQRDKELKAKEGLPRLAWLQTDVPLYFYFLSEIIELPCHKKWEETTYGTKKKGKEVYYICDRLYEGSSLIADVGEGFETDCPHCHELNDRGKHEKPSPYRFATVHALSREGQVIGEGDKAYKLDTVVNIVIRPGKGLANFKNLDKITNKALPGKPGRSATDPGLFIFEMYKTGSGKETQYFGPSVANMDLLGDEFDPDSQESKDNRNRYAAMDESERFQHTLCSLGNVRWEEFGLDEPKPIVVESKDEEPTTQPASKRSRKALE